MKAQVKAKEEELVVQAEKQSKYYGKYEDRIAQANEEAERQRQRAEEVQYKVQELEDELEAQRQEL